MKSAVVALLLGAASSKNLNDVGDIWNESTEDYYICSRNPQERFNDYSNSWDTFANAYRSGSPWVDTDFRANMRSIYSNQAPPDGGTYNFDRYIIGWKRPKDIYPGEEVHLKGTQGIFAPSGIKQGGLGDCWFLAGVTALAEQPERLNQIVHKNSRENYPEAGIFRYFFWVEKEWVAINIDDQLPVRYKYSNSRDYYSTFATGRSNFGAWWMPLLEKAYSKLYGNYERIEGGSGFESLRMLTNKPTFFFQHDKVSHKQDEMFRLFHKMARENYPMVVGCCDTYGDAPDGLVNAHAYTLLDVIELAGTKLAKMRNPWSKEGYNGPWSDNDSRWTPALLQEAGHTKANDGVFFIPFANFLRKPYFDRTSVAIYKDFSTTTMYSISQTVQQLNIRVTIPSRQVVYFTLETQSSRFQRNCSRDRNRVNMFFFPGNQYGGRSSLIFDVGVLMNGLFHWTVGKPDHELDAGTYTLLVANFAGNVNPMNYQLTVYQEGSGQVDIQY